MALTKVQADGVNLADDFAFTGTVSGAGQMVLLQTITASADTEIDFTSLFTSTYKNYELHGTNVHVSSDGAHIGMRFFVGGSIKSDSHYRYTRIRLYSGSTSSVSDMVVGAVEQTDTDFAMVGGESVGNATGENTNFKITIFDPLGTDNYKMMKAETSYIDLSPDSGQIHASGHYKNGTAALTGVRIFPNTGNIASGELKLYGVI
tara:strand:+ start:339 stop:953 length:615 start_codon:yes stop_codon:yes gene_type:complete